MAAAQSVALKASRSEAGLTLTVSIRLPSEAQSVGCASVLPTGWHYVSGKGEPALRPGRGQTGLLEWADVRTSDTLEFSFVARPNSESVGAGKISLTAYWVQHGTVREITAEPIEI